MAGCVVILGTLDTKGAEIEFLRQAVRTQGGDPLVMDTGVLGEPTVAADITRHQVAEAAGSSIKALVEAGDKTQALVVMAEGAARILQRLLADGSWVAPCPSAARGARRWAPGPCSRCPWACPN
jgi:uncharacterized protein (UPF0261 family)